MNPAGRYLVGLGLTAAGAAAATLLVPAGVRLEVGWGSLIGLVLQAPLGWWVVQSIGTERLMVTWGLGMLVRATVVAIAGLVIIPAVGWQAAPLLGAMVGVLVALLAVEVVTAVQGQSRT